MTPLDSLHLEIFLGIFWKFFIFLKTIRLADPTAENSRRRGSITAQGITQVSILKDALNLGVRQHPNRSDPDTEEMK